MASALDLDNSNDELRTTLQKNVASVRAMEEMAVVAIRQFCSSNSVVPQEKVLETIARLLLDWEIFQKFIKIETTAQLKYFGQYCDDQESFKEILSRRWQFEKIEVLLKQTNPDLMYSAYIEELARRHRDQSNDGMTNRQDSTTTHRRRRHSTDLEAPDSTNSMKYSAAQGKSGTDAITWTWPTKGSVSQTKKGIDIIGNRGQDVRASANGEVIYNGTDIRGLGRIVVIKHEDRYLTVYAHNGKVIVREGQKVVQNQKIAEMGDSDADEVKLHFEIRRFGKPIDPIIVLPKSQNESSRFSWRMFGLS